MTTPDGLWCTCANGAAWPGLDGDWFLCSLCAKPIEVRTVEHNRRWLREVQRRKRPT